MDHRDTRRRAAFRIDLLHNASFAAMAGAAAMAGPAAVVDWPPHAERGYAIAIDLDDRGPAKSAGDRDHAPRTATMIASGVVRFLGR